MTNDDVAMSMAAHGYGLFAQSSPALFFSNAVWGHIVSTIPSIGGILGYSLATLAVLLISGSTLLYFCLQRGLGIALTMALFVLIMLRPTLFPQFTINAGLLSISALLLLRLFLESGNRIQLVAAVALACGGYFIRNLEFYIVVLIALPLFDWKAILRRNDCRWALFVLLGLCVAGFFLDSHTYSEHGWKAYNALNPVRAMFTDYGAGAHLKQHLGIATQYGYTANDIDLVSNWFFIDPLVADPIKLGQMLRDLGPIPAAKSTLANAWQGITTLAHPSLLPLTVAAVSMFVIIPSIRVSICWALFLAAILTFGLLGRPGALRVYIPLLSLLVIAPLLCSVPAQMRRLAALMVCTACAYINSDQTVHISVSYTRSAADMQKSLAHFPTDPVSIWGGVFPFEAVYPVLHIPPHNLSFKLAGLGVTTLAPTGYAHSTHLGNKSLLTRLLSKDGLPMIAHEPRLALLSLYCKERQRGTLSILASQAHGSVIINVVRCVQDSAASLPTQAQLPHH
ncbi:MAG TPA: hypothetical protein VM512_00200 [Burkholderiaceae bacterium]|jgi:hypothetical protein|nr:hypothetical protein [Burkholderiaceae bacterium]